MPPAPQILIVDDEPGIRASLSRTLQSDGYQVSTADGKNTALEQIGQNEFDLILLDLKLGNDSGLDVLAVVHNTAPDSCVIILTGYASLETSVQALRQGAFDYLFKPAKNAELRHSIRQALQERARRLKYRHVQRQLKQLSTLLESEPSTPTLTPNLPHRFLQQQDLIIDAQRHVAVLDGQPLELSPTEFEILAYLVKESQRVVSAEELVEQVQGYHSESWEANQIARQHIYRIRFKIKETTGRTNIIQTVRGVGYTLQQP